VVPITIERLIEIALKEVGFTLALSGFVYLVNQTWTHEFKAQHTIQIFQADTPFSPLLLI
jgi:hypothetical protein